MNKSISLHNKSQYSGGGGGDEENNQSYHHWAKNNSKVVNIDDIPITSKAKTFEELLESNLKEGGQEYSSIEDVVKPRNEKKQFLKKKSKKMDIPAGPTKRYNYYIENFEEVKKPPTSREEHDLSHIKPEPRPHENLK